MPPNSSIKQWLKRIAIASAAFLLLVASTIGYAWWYYHPAYSRVDGIVYGTRNGRELTMDVFKPLKPNGLGVAFMVSGGWKSKKPGEADAWILAPLIRRGYTVFAVCHVSQPDALIPEIIDDVNRGVRFIKYHSEEYGIDPERLGVTGGSAGGHLSLMLSTRGCEGPIDSGDPIDRMSSSVKATAIFYPVTDLLDLNGSTEDPGDGGPPKSFVKAFGDAATEMDTWKEVGKECSPIYYVNEKLPPVLIYHGDADTLVPLDQSQRFQQIAQKVDRDVKIVVHRGGSHGWATMFLDIIAFADWFDQHLRANR
ncbi:MAG: alpha/beta hydrolase [Planctomycetes bacterium]|nr:alpha/beta hydrolase [Planctomycetota bacterium]